MSLSPPSFQQAKVVSLFTIIFYLLLVAGGLWLLYALRFLFGPLLIALTIALTLAPLTDRMERRGWNRETSILVIYAVFLAAFIGILLIMVPVVSHQIHAVANSVMPTANVHANTLHLLIVIHQWLSSLGVSDVIQAPILERVGLVPAYLGSYLNRLATALPVFASNIVLAIFIVIAAFYLLNDYHKIVGKVLVFIPPGQRMRTLRVISEVVAVYGNYVRGVVIVMLMDIVVIYIALRLLHIHNAETIAVVSGVLYAILYIGAVISTILVGLAALAGHSIAWSLLTTAIMIVIHQIIFDQIIAPRVIGRQVGLHPLWAITAMMIGYTLMDVGGTLLAVPLAGAIQVVLVHLLPKLRDEDLAKTSADYAHGLAMPVDPDPAMPVSPPTPEISRADSA